MDDPFFTPPPLVQKETEPTDTWDFLRVDQYQFTPEQVQVQGGTVLLQLETRQFIEERLEQLDPAGVLRLVLSQLDTTTLPTILGPDIFDYLTESEIKEVDVPLEACRFFKEHLLPRKKLGLN